MEEQYEKEKVQKEEEEDNLANSTVVITLFCHFAFAFLEKSVCTMPVSSANSFELGKYSSYEEAVVLISSANSFEVGKYSIYCCY